MSKNKPKKNAAAKKQTAKPSQAEQWSLALDAESDGRWSDAAKVWAELAKTGSKKEKADAAGRAAAARVRAEAQQAAPEPTVAPEPAQDVPADQPANESTAAPEAPTAKPKRTRAPKPPTAPRERDPRLPPVGTVIQKKDRAGNVRCECTVEEGGIRYKDELFKSLSGAAMAAAKDLGLENKTQNGFAFWGITKPTRPAKDVLESLGHAWERYRERVSSAIKSATEADRDKVQALLKVHAGELGARAQTMGEI